jgi:predicted nuclease of predicted toxin-antitoxin system
VRWLIDESVDAALAVELRNAGHEVIYVAEVDPRANDLDILLRAEREDRLLLTEDKDFGELVFRQG